MMRSMYSGVSGLKNHQTRMDVIGNNIANINTAGYKKSRVVFKDTLYQNLRGATSPVEGGRGGTNPMGIGLGMSVSSIDQIHTGAATTSTNKAMDMAIDGNGYFVIKNGDQEYFTRAGNFDFDSDGKLINVSNGYTVQGWVTQINDVTGEWYLDWNREPESIDLKNFKSCAPQPTKQMTFSGNLNANTPYNEVQILSFAADPDGGTAGGKFQLTYNGQNTNWIAVGINPEATATNIQTALEALSGIGEDNVAVTWNSTNNNYEIEFQGDLASQGVANITATIGPVVAFDGGDPDVDSTDLQNQTLAFDTTANGGTAGGGFTITVGTKTTGMILVGADGNATASNIQTALNAAGKPATVTWDGSEYTIAFNIAPTESIQVATFDNAFDGGSALLATRPVGGVFAHVLRFAADAEGGDQDGVFQLTFNGEKTDWISVGADTAATAANIQSALENLSNVGTGNIAVSWNAANSNYEIRLQGDLASLEDPSITVTTGSAVPFDGGSAGVAGTTQNATLAFGTTANGGTAGGGFTITLNGQTTDMILVGATEAATAANIAAALDAIGATTTSVAWNGGTSTFDIAFTADPGSAMTVQTYDTAFSGGTGTILPPAVDVYYPTTQESVITSKKVYDSDGNDITVYYRFFKYEMDEGPPRVARWAVDISLNPLFETDDNYSAEEYFSSVDLNTTAPTAALTADKQIIRLTNLEFDDNGRMVGDTPDLDPFTLNIDRSANVAQDISYKIDFSTMNQYASDSSLEIVQNGYGKGSLISHSVGIDGIISGVYDNGETRSLARVALARFENPAGMIQVGGTLFQESSNSGQKVLGTPGDSGMGSIVPSSLEMSNVDLSEEFTDMIVTQRGFQANSRIITTSDEMIQELVNLKR